MREGVSPSDANVPTLIVLRAYVGTYPVLEVI